MFKTRAKVPSIGILSVAIAGGVGVIRTFKLDIK